MVFFQGVSHQSGVTKAMWWVVKQKSKMYCSPTIWLVGIPRFLTKKIWGWVVLRGKLFLQSSFWVVKGDFTKWWRKWGASIQVVGGIEHYSSRSLKGLFFFWFFIRKVAENPAFSNLEEISVLDRRIGPIHGTLRPARKNVSLGSCQFSNSQKIYLGHTPKSSKLSSYLVKL